MNKTTFTPLIFLLLVVISGTFFLVNSFSTFFNCHDYVEGQDVLDDFSIVGFHLFNLSSEEDPLEESKGIKVKKYKPDLYRSLDAVRVSLSKGDYLSSENELRNLLIFYPDNRTVLSLLGGILYLSGKYNQAIAIFSALKKIYPYDVSIKEDLGFQYEKKRNYKMAIREFKEALNVSEDSSISCIHLAGLYSILGEKKEAILYFRKAHALLGAKILVFSYDPVFNNIRNMPDFVLIVHKYLN